MCVSREWGRACRGWLGSLYREFHVTLCRELYWLCMYAHQGCCLLKERLFTTNTLRSYFYVAFLYLWILPASLLLCLNDRQKNLIDLSFFLVLIYGFDIKSKLFKVQILYIVCLQFMILLVILIFFFFIIIINYSLLLRTFNWWALKEEVGLDSRGAHRGESLGLFMPLLNALVLYLMW